MKLWINAIPRKDLKYACNYGFDNGRQFKKIRTFDQIKNELAARFGIEITNDDLNNTLLKARQLEVTQNCFMSFKH